MSRAALFVFAATLVFASGGRVSGQEKAPEAEAPEVVAPEADFDALADAAIDRATGEIGDRSALNRLWTSLYQLESWHVVTLPDQPTRPYLARFDGKIWIMAFTDSKRLEAFVKADDGQLGLTGEDGGVLFLSLQPAKARDWLTDLGQRGVFGVRFNQGEHGWFSPMQNLVPIHSHLVKLGLLEEPAALDGEVDLVLLSYGQRKIHVLKEVRSITGLGLKDTKALIERAPVTIKAGLTRAEAEALKAKIEAVGGTVELLPVEAVRAEEE